MQLFEDNVLQMFVLCVNIVINLLPHHHNIQLNLMSKSKIMKVVFALCLALFAICNGNVWQQHSLPGYLADPDGTCDTTTHEGRQCVKEIVGK